MKVQENFKSRRRNKSGEALGVAVRWVKPLQAPTHTFIWYQLSCSQGKKASCQISCNTAAAADTDLLIKKKAHSFFHPWHQTFIFKLVYRQDGHDKQRLQELHWCDFTTNPQWKQTSHIHSVWALSPAMHRDTPTPFLHTDSARNQQFGWIKSTNLSIASSFILGAHLAHSIMGLKSISKWCCGI